MMIVTHIREAVRCMSHQLVEQLQHAEEPHGQAEIA